jgi:hypothetical protein
LPTAAELFVPHKPEETPSLQKVVASERRREQRKQQQHEKPPAAKTKTKVTQAQVGEDSHLVVPQLS